MKIMNIEEIVEKKDLYHCGSPNLNNFLQDNGLDYISSYVSKKKNKTIWLYIKCDELSDLLTVWTKNKKGGEILTNE